MSKHKDVISVATGRPVPPDPTPDLGPVNTHPGPDLDREAEAG